MDPNAEVAKRSWSLFLFGIVMAGIPTAIIIYNLSWVVSLFTGPAAMNAADLASIENASQLANKWVNLNYTSKLETGLGFEKTKNGKTITKSAYVLIPCGDKFLLANIPDEDLSSNPISGYLAPFTGKIDLEALEKIKTKMPPQAKLLSFQMDSVYRMRSQGFAMLGVCGFFLVCGGFMLVAGLRKPVEPTSTEPTVKTDVE